MGKRGGTKHRKRVAVPKSIPITNKKENTWAIKSYPGPHNGLHCIPLGMLLRDILKVTKTAKETTRVLTNRLVKVDGKVRVEAKFPVGLMDVIEFSGSQYRMVVKEKGRLYPVEVGKDETGTKILKVVKKHTQKGNKIVLTFHDGKVAFGDNNIKVGDSVVFDISGKKIKSVLKLDKGANCLLIEGKHSGLLAKLQEISEKEGTKPQATLKADKGELITVAEYLLVVDDSFKV